MYMIYISTIGHFTHEKENEGNHSTDSNFQKRKKVGHFPPILKFGYLIFPEEAGRVTICMIHVCACKQCA